MSWLDIIVNVASAIERVDEGVALVAALQLAGNPTTETKRALVIGSEAASFLGALDRSLRAQHKEWPVILVAQARALLLQLPPLVDRLRRGSVQPERVAAVLTTVEELAAQIDAATGGLRSCRRCGSTRVDEQRTSADGVNYYEQRCGACGNYETWEDGLSLGEAMIQASKPPGSD